MAATLRIDKEGDWKRFERALHRLGRLSFLGLHQEVGEALVTSTRLRFRHGVDPEGNRWPPSRRAQSEGGQTLRDTGLLANSIHYQAGGRHVEVGTNDKRARVHQEGLEIRAKRARYLRFKVDGGWVQLKSVKMPRRAFLGISEDDQREIQEIVQQRIEEALS
ncbi:MAG: phage virion morphogenesis protein [Firmicutes bacterium ZCTH02-B6]|nr:MAG: phage virion morphogenesis protein [Firmicutes bacterium ZCTH02-B6]